MKPIFTFILVILFLNCNQTDSNKEDKNPESSSLGKDTLKNKSADDKSSSISKNFKGTTDTTLLLNTSAEILKAIKKRDYNKLASFVQDMYGIRFSPYAYIDTINDIKLTSVKLIQLGKQQKFINWHSSLENTVTFMSIDSYFKKFVYDVDFLNAEIKSINEFHSQGTDLNNITEVYPGCDVVEFFFSGFDKKYDGMDFRGLRLVFKMHDKNPFLIAIVHDEWTP